jgi:hypothetical protein
MAEPPDIFLEENHPMTISSKFCDEILKESSPLKTTEPISTKLC